MLHLPFTINLKQPRDITTEEVRGVIREISDRFYGEVLDEYSLNDLNYNLDLYVNRPYNLNIKAELTPYSRSPVTLFGYDDDSKAVLDQNCKVKSIQTNLPIWRRK